MKSRICRIWQNELYKIRSVLVFGGMGSAAPTVGTLVNRGGYNPEVRVRGGRVAHTWRAGRGTGQGRGGGQTRRMGAPLRVGKGHHVVPALHFQTLFCFPLARALRHAVYVFASAVPRGCAALFSLLLLLRCVLLLHSMLVLLCVVVLESGFLVALHLHFS